MAQIAEDGDVVDDATVHWPDNREVVDLGTMKLEAIEEDGRRSRSESSSTRCRVCRASNLLMILCWRLGPRCISSAVESGVMHIDGLNGHSQI